MTFSNVIQLNSYTLSLVLIFINKSLLQSVKIFEWIIWQEDAYIC